MSKLLDKALCFAMDAHAGQFRKDGKTPYIVHPVSVAMRIVRWGFNNEYMLAATLLHDVIEDTTATRVELEAEFGMPIASIVDALTFHGDPGMAKQHWLDGFVEKPLVRIIKAADRLCNTQDFIDDGNFEYAYKYFHQADKLFDSISKNVPECIDRRCVAEDMEFMRKMLESLINSKVTK